ncbi:MAG: hypothetical protein U0359_02465 [Byssovorax sp.]
MPLRRPLAALAILIALPVLGGCPTEPPPRPKDPAMVEDEWSRTAPSKEWLYATSEFSGDHKAECAHVLPWVKGEARCRASLCEHGRDLASEWMTRCPRYAPASASAEVRELRDKLAERATEKATECGKKLDDMLRSGCGGDDKTCQRSGQLWATRCAKAEATPLVMRILEKTIERKLDEPGDVSLDDRTCEELHADVVEASRCKDKFACADALTRVDAYRSRCESDEDRPTLATAVQEQAVVVGAGKPGVPILVRAGSAAVLPDELPVTLADGSGAVITLCDERASDLTRYMASRKSCTAGTMVVARAFKTARGVEVRSGSLDFPDEATFSARYPTILAAREQDIRDKEELAALDGELGRLADLSKTAAGVTDTFRGLARTLASHAPALRRSAQFRQLLAARDDAFVPAFKELGKAKMAALKGKVAPADANGLIQRGKTRAYADVSLDGAVEIGVRTRATRLDLNGPLPRAMAAYTEAMKTAKPRKLDKNTVKLAKSSGVAAAAICGAAEKKLQESKGALISCNFGLETCDDAKVGQLLKTVDESRTAAESAYHDLDLARTGGAADEADDLGKSAEAYGCREPWW